MITNVPIVIRTRLVPSMILLLLLSQVTEEHDEME